MTLAISDRELTAAADAMPPIGRVLQRLLATLQDPNSDISDITRLVMIDPALSAQLLRLANSPLFKLPEPVATVDLAIQHIGLNEVARLATTLGGRELVARPLSRYNTSANLLWQHSLAVAVGCDVVAERFLIDRSVAYMAGLLHPLGMVVIDQLAESRNLRSRPQAVPLRAWEKARFGADNATIAGRLLRHWNFPEDVAHAVASRYERPAPATGVQLGGVLFIASNIAERIPAGLPPEAGLFALDAERLAALGIDREQWCDLELSVVRQLSRVQASFNLA